MYCIDKFYLFTNTDENTDENIDVICDLEDILRSSSYYGVASYIYELINSIECAICYYNIINYQKTPCNHIFCKNCIQICLASNNSCPYCRMEI